MTSDEVRTWGEKAGMETVLIVTECGPRTYRAALIACQYSIATFQWRGTPGAALDDLAAMVRRIQAAPKL